MDNLGSAVACEGWITVSSNFRFADQCPLLNRLVSGMACAGATTLQGRAGRNQLCPSLALRLEQANELAVLGSLEEELEPLVKVTGEGELRTKVG